MRRWQVEVTFEEARRYLGGEAQRGRSDAIIARTTPAVLGLVAIVTLLASRLMGDGTLPVRAAAWYAKHTPTFIDALAAVRARWRRPRRGHRETAPPSRCKTRRGSVLHSVND